MNVLVVDTSSWISYFKGNDDQTLELALEESRVYLPPIVVSELLSAKMSEADRRKLIDLLQDLPLCESGFDHWVRVGHLRNTLSQKGITISTPDAHVAQCALDLNGYLLSLDKIFAQTAKILKMLKLV